MRYFRNRSRRFLLLSAVVGVVVLGGSAIAYAAYPTNSVAVMTGCLTASGTGSGNIVNVGMGTSPAKACGSNQKQIQLSGGTITQVTAGTGLSTAGSGGTGGSGFVNNGFVTLGLLPGFTLPQNCTSGQFPSSNGAGSGFGCGTDKTYSGADFATSGQSCPTGQFVTGIDSNGALTCAQPCIVVNTTSDMPYLTLQAADTAATADDTLVVHGTCVGNTTIDKNLTITGQGSAILDGGGSGSVLTIGSGVAATLNTLTITNGGGSFCAINTSLLRGGGICNLGTLTLNNSTVSNNSAQEGGGIWMHGTATLNDSTVSQNSAQTREGGGIYNYANGNLTVNGSSSIDHNSAASSGGGIDGKVTLNGSSSVTNNTAGGAGGGIHSNNAVMNGTSTLSGNSTSGFGGGIFVGAGGSLTMNDNSTIHDNSASNQGGGIYLQAGFGGGPPDASAIGAVAATACPPTGSENVYCNTPNNIITGP
jgi:hypothetical protein